MPFVRRGTFKRKRNFKRTFKKRATFRPRKSLATITPHPSFKRTYFYENLLQEAGGNMSHAYTVKLSDLPDYSEFTNLFDQYRIRKVIFRFEPTFDINDMQNAGSYSLKYVRSVIDKNDNTPYSTEAMYFQHDTMRSHAPNRVFTRTINLPSVAGMVYNGGVSTAYIQENDKWVDMSNPSVPHYGLKVWVSTTGLATNTLLYRVIVTVYFQCKHMK